MLTQKKIKKDEITQKATQQKAIIIILLVSVVVLAALLALPKFLEGLNAQKHGSMDDVRDTFTLSGFSEEDAGPDAEPGGGTDEPKTADQLRIEAMSLAGSAQRREIPAAYQGNWGKSEFCPEFAEWGTVVNGPGAAITKKEIIRYEYGCTIKKTAGGTKTGQQEKHFSASFICSGEGEESEEEIELILNTKGELSLDGDEFVPRCPE